MADQLTDSEAKMLRVLAERHELMEFNDDDDKEAWPEASIMAFGAELLLAAKERHMGDVSIALYGHPNERITKLMKEFAKSDWGDLFEVK